MFGDNLKALRTKHNLVQSELAQKLNISVRALSSYETNQREPNLELITKIAYYFHISLDELFGITPEIIDSDDSEKKKKELSDKIKAMSDNEIKKVLEYVEFLESKRI